MSLEPIRIEISLGIMFQTVNCYLLPGDQLTLIDCGLYSESNWNIFQKKINEIGYRVGDIEQVIITHEHRDHIGLLPEIMANSNASVLAPASIQERFIQPEKIKEDQVKFNKSLFKTLGFPPKQLKQVFEFVDLVEMSRTIQEVDRMSFFTSGDFLQMGNTDWEILNTPGHTPTQYVFLQKEQKRIFGSDMLLPVAPMPIAVEDANEPNGIARSMDQLLDSYDRLKLFEIDKVYPGHGKEFSNANAMIDKQLARIQVRKEECYTAIKEGLSTPYQINRKMYPYRKHSMKYIYSIPIQYTTFAKKTKGYPERYVARVPSFWERVVGVERSSYQEFVGEYQKDIPKGHALVG